MPALRPADLVRLPLPAATRALALRHGPAALLGLSAALLLLRPISDPDIWFHLAIGRETALRGAVPAEEFYVLPLLGTPGRFHEWGFGLLFHLVERAFGASGMSVLNAAVGAAIAVFLFLAARLRAGAGWPALAAVALALGLMEFRLVYRPETLLYLALAMGIWLGEHYLASRRIVWLTSLPLLALLLTQVHPSAMFLVALSGAYGLQALVDHPERGRTLVRFAALAALTAGAACLNPYGVDQLLLPLRFAAEADMLREFTEFLPALETGYRYHFLIALAAAVTALAFGPSRRAVDLLLAAAFAFLAYRYVRNIALLALVLAVPAAAALRRLFDALAAPAAAPLAATAAAIACVAGTVWHGGWGIGVDADSIPARAATTLARLAPPGPVFNFLHLGNYLAWRLGPAYPVAIDGRNFGRNRALGLHDEVFRADPGWQARLGHFGFQSIVTPATLEYAGEVIPLVVALDGDPDWALVAVEPAALTFMRAHRVPPADRLPAVAIWRQAERELLRNLRFYPDSETTRASLRRVRARLAAAD